MVFFQVRDYQVVVYSRPFWLAFVVAAALLGFGFARTEVDNVVYKVYEQRQLLNSRRIVKKE